MSKSEQARQMHSKDPKRSKADIARELGVDPSTVKQAIEYAKEEAPRVQDPAQLAKLVGRMIKKRAMSHGALAEALGIAVDQLPPVLDELAKTRELSHRGGLVSLSEPDFGYLPIDIVDGDGWAKIGLVADTHLGCREERLDALHAMYDLFAVEGITDVFHAGNIVDGYVARINGASAIVTTVDDQMQYVCDNYPRRDGITTHYITGDDHEGWWIKEGLNFGKLLQLLCEEQGRTDLKYIGHVEGDVEFKGRGGSVVMKVQHPGGGSSYARSYTGQKQVESFQGGEKPAILVQGHYHVSNFMSDRNVYVIGMPGFEDQTVFARKKRLRMEVGGAILEFKQSPVDGSITRLRLEFKLFYDRKFYRAFLHSDAKLIKGHIVKEYTAAGANVSSRRRKA